MSDIQARPGNPLEEGMLGSQATTVGAHRECVVGLARDMNELLKRQEEIRIANLELSLGVLKNEVRTVTLDL